MLKKNIEIILRSEENNKENNKYLKRNIKFS